MPYKYVITGETVSQLTAHQIEDNLKPLLVDLVGFLNLEIKEVTEEEYTYAKLNEISLQFINGAHEHHKAMEEPKDAT